MKRQVETFLNGLGSLEGYSSSTLQAYASDLRSFVEYLSGELGRSPVVHDFNSESINAYLEAQERTGRQPSTLYRRRATLRQFGRYLAQQGQLESNPLADTNTVGAIAVPAPPLSVLSPQEVSRVRGEMQAAQHPRAARDLAMFNLLLETGLSTGALVSLDLEDLRSEGRRLQVSTSNGSDASLPIETASPALRRYVRESRLDLAHSSDEPALFLSQMGSRMSRQAVWQVLRNWGKQAGLSKELSPRLVRHTAVQRMVKAGRPLDEIQKLLGHRNPLSTRALVRRVRALSPKPHKTSLEKPSP